MRISNWCRVEVKWKYSFGFSSEWNDEFYFLYYSPVLNGHVEAEAGFLQEVLRRFGYFHAEVQLSKLSKLFPRERQPRNANASKNSCSVIKHVELCAELDVPQSGTIRQYSGDRCGQPFRAKSNTFQRMNEHRLIRGDVFIIRTVSPRTSLKTDGVLQSFVAGEWGVQREDLNNDYASVDTPSSVFARSFLKGQLRFRRSMWILP